MPEPAVEAVRETAKPNRQAIARAEEILKGCDALVGKNKVACASCVAKAIQAERDAFLRMVREVNEWAPTGADGRNFAQTLKRALTEALVWDLGAK